MKRNPLDVVVVIIIIHIIIIIVVVVVVMHALKNWEGMGGGGAVGHKLISQHVITKSYLIYSLFQVIKKKKKIEDCMPPPPPPRARCSSVVRAFGRRIDPSWGGPIELFLVPASAPRLVLSCLWDLLYREKCVLYVFSPNLQVKLN